MKPSFVLTLAALFAALVPALNLAAADAKPTPVVCVSLMSETDEGQISYRVGKADWKVVKLGDTVPADAELRVNVDRDWAEFVPEKDPLTVYRLDGPDQGEKVVKVADLLKTTARKVSFPKVGKDTDPAFKNKLVAKRVTGRVIYRASPDTKDQDVVYGTVMDVAGKVKIIGINNPLLLALPNGAETSVVGPLNFEVKKVLEGSPLYKYLNVTK